MPGELAELSLNGNVPLMRVINDLFGHGDILFIIEMGPVDHHRGEAAVDAVLAQLKTGAVIQMERNGKTRLFNGPPAPYGSGKRNGHICGRRPTPAE